MRSLTLLPGLNMVVMLFFFNILPMIIGVSFTYVRNVLFVFSLGKSLIGWSNFILNVCVLKALLNSLFEHKLVPSVFFRWGFSSYQLSLTNILSSLFINVFNTELFWAGWCREAALRYLLAYVRFLYIAWSIEPSLFLFLLTSKKGSCLLSILSSSWQSHLL